MTSKTNKISKPTEFRKRDWWSIAKRLIGRIEEHSVVMLSAAVSFYAMLAVFPALSALVTTYALIADPQDVVQHFNSLAGVIPMDVAQLFNDQIIQITQIQSETLGFRLFIGLVFSLWSAHRGIHALIHAITIAYQEKETRNIIKLNVFSLAMTLGATLIMVVAMTIMLALPAVLNFLPIVAWQATLSTVFSWIAFLIAVIFALNMLYRYSPPRRPASWNWLSPGALLATVLCLLSSIGFSIYVQYVGNYNETYGTLGAFIVLLLWFYLTNFSIVLGAILNAEMELQTSADTTAGRSRPMGERGAYVADTPPPKNEKNEKNEKTNEPMKTNKTNGNGIKPVIRSIQRNLIVRFARLILLR